MSFPLKTPTPDFQQLEKVIKGEKKPEKVHFVEWSVDYEVMGFILSKMLGKKLPYLEIQDIRQKKIARFAEGHKIVLLTEKEEKVFMKRYIEFYYQMGYDYIPDRMSLEYFKSMIMPKVRLGKDTAIIPKKEGREWVEEKTGIITSWEDFEKFPWERIKLNPENYYEFLNENLPDGMRTVVNGSLYEQVLERLLGYEGLFYLLYDQPDLVQAVVNKWGEILYEFYKNAISLEIAGAIFHGDDLGYKTGTMVSPDILRKLVFPWFKKYASLAHQYGKMYWYHCCGNVLEVMEDLIENVKIDAFHSFQDVIISVIEFKKRYGNKIATLGGVDIDKLSRLDEKSLRNYVGGILDNCMPGGKYALGSGNSIANYIPVKNYLIMLEEGLRWGNNK